uniref:hypothetical protein n=1 Tax=Gelidibacter sp. TaxID=2018083 RepID=UPI00404B60C4
MNFKITLFLLFCFSLTNAQINITKSELKTDDTLDKLKYLENKEVFIIQPNYMDFYDNYKNQEYSEKKLSKDGEYFNITKVFKYECETSDCVGSYTDIYNRGNYIIQLIRKTDSDTLYLKERFIEMSKFTVVEDFNNFKKEYSGKKYVTRGVNNMYSGIKDISTNEKIELIAGDVWEVIDYTLDLDETVYNKRFILQNGNTKISVAVDYILDKSQFFSIEESEKHLKRYGASNWNIILKRQVIIGFTKEMCKLSWGEPVDINTSSHSPEQWVYNGDYLYFEGDKLVAFN